MACRRPGDKPLSEPCDAGILFIGPQGTHFSEILIEIHTFSLKKMRLKMSSAKWRPSCLGLNVYTGRDRVVIVHVDILAPKDARPSAGTGLTIKLKVFF